MGLYLPHPVFSHGQLNVALSRVGDPDEVHVLVVPGEQQGPIDGHDGVYTLNVVYPDVLADALNSANTGLLPTLPNAPPSEPIRAAVIPPPASLAPLREPDDDTPDVYADAMATNQERAAWPGMNDAVPAHADWNGDAVEGDAEDSSDNEDDLPGEYLLLATLTCHMCFGCV